MVQGASDKEQALDAGQLADAADLLRTLGTPHRLAIVLELASAPRCVHELVERVGISQSLASQHLRILRTTGLVSGTRRGKETVYALADEHVAHIARDAFTHGAESALHNRPRSGPTIEEHES
ncbi:MAG TPA: metalloregulator ArsR/SmtB family transcription factor [Acidimicrobiales bacterium]|nr:metalloregulator ArsR/SmtB family transcription factor [Acidimicrobiales bacterium]